MRLKRTYALVPILVVVVFGLAVWAYSGFVDYESRLEAWPPRSQQNSGPVRWKPKNPEVIRILTLDGGGARGLVSLEILKYLEQKTGKPIAELFDFVAGTSTGAIIATQLLLPDADGVPKHSASSLIETYTELMDQVFSVPWYHRVLTLDGALGPRFLNSHKIALANERYGRARFGDLLLPVMILSYSITSSNLHEFANWTDESANLYLAPLVSAVTSAPTAFPAIQLQGDSPEAGEYMDGGIIANDPSHLAFDRALDRYPEARFVLVSVGAGLTIYEVAPDQAIRGGVLSWIEPLSWIMFDGHADVVSITLQEFADANSSIGLKYYRFNPRIPLGRGSWDDGSPGNLALLKSIGENEVREQKQRLDEAIELLQQD